MSTSGLCSYGSSIGGECIQSHRPHRQLFQANCIFTRLRDNEPAILEACKKDLGKGIFESIVTEVDWCANDIIFCCDNLAKWAKDESAADIPLSNKLLRPKIRKDPLGCVLIIGFVKLVP